MSSAQPVPHRWTYSDLVALPEDRLRHELIDGEHFVTPSPNTAHQIILGRLFILLSTFVTRRGVGEVLVAPFDVKLSPYTVLVPDLLFFTADRFAGAVNDKHATAAPDLVVEILSPSTRRRDLGRKRAVYDREGVREYWVLDPVAESVAVLRRTAEGGGLADVRALTASKKAVLQSPLFPGLKIRLAQVFSGSAAKAGRTQ
jgi:Uma2 family endonuclease